MKAAIRSKYGPPEVLSIKEIDIPNPKDNEVLIRVYAATVNRTDCHILSGWPFIMRFFTGLFKPGIIVTGTDFAGKIEAIGKKVKSFKTGDRVMGFAGFGLRSHAQYLSLAETKAIMIPNNTGYDQAAACIEGAFYALNAVNLLKPKAGQKALVIGATGAIGSATVQFLKFYGAFVTAVSGSETIELVKSLGADRVIDYKTNDFTKDTEKYDLVFDSVGKYTFGKCKHLLKKKGIYTSSGGFQNLFPALFTPLFGGKKVLFLPPKNIKACLGFINDLVEKGSFKPVIDKKYPIDKIAEAYKYVASGQKIGNVIITMDA
ncbi:MAG: NAD(P)-dependent alcohol dehydrogenase [Chitinophagales bacterium]